VEREDEDTNLVSKESPDLGFAKANTLFYRRMLHPSAIRGKRFVKGKKRGGNGGINWKTVERARKAERYKNRRDHHRRINAGSLFGEGNETWRAENKKCD